MLCTATNSLGGLGLGVFVVFCVLLVLAIGIGIQLRIWAASVPRAIALAMVLLGVGPNPWLAMLLVRVDRVSMALVGLGGENLCRCSWPLRAGAGAPREVVTRVVESAGMLAGELGAPVVAAGVSVPGVVRRTDGLVREAPHLRWVDVPLGERLSAALRIPVAVANDGELGEHTRGMRAGRRTWCSLSAAG